MRKLRRVFWDALLSLGLSWGIAHYHNPTDLEGKLFIAIGLAALCLLIILPKAFHSLPEGKPWLSALALPFMLSPLIFLLSRPDLYFTPFSVLWTGQQALLIHWGINALFNSLILMIAGFRIARSTTAEKPISWSKSIFFTLVLAVLYAGIVYLGLRLFWQG